MNEYITDINTKNAAQGVFVLLTMPRNKMVVVTVTEAQLSSYIYISPNALSDEVWKVSFHVHLSLSKGR